MSRPVGALLVVLFATACEQPEPACFPLAIDCSGVAAPTFAELHATVLGPSCGRGGSCHVEDDLPAGDLRLDDDEVAYEALLDARRTLVFPDRPHCSELVRRVTSSERRVRMPPAQALGSREACLIVAWIAAGAAP